MSIEDNKRLVRRYFEDAPFNPAACDEIFAPSFQFHTIMHASVTAQTVKSSPDDERAAFERHKATFGGWHFNIEEMIAEDDRVMVRWTSHGTHVGELNGLPPTGRYTTNSGINIFRVTGGKIVEVWDIFDRLWAWQQLGVLPELKDAIAKAKESILNELPNIVQRKKHTAGIFDRAAATYDHVGPHFFSHFGRRLVEIARIPAGANVLDVATGRGAVLYPAAETVGAQGHVTGIDLSESMVRETIHELARRKISSNVEVRQMDAEHLQFPDESFDYVLCGFAIFFFPQLELAMSEFRRVLKPNGQICVTTWNKIWDDQWNWVDEMFKAYLPPEPETHPVAESDAPPQPVFDTPEGLTAILSAAGFGDIQIFSEAADFVYATEEDLWSTWWSHGVRAPLEQIEQTSGPDGLLKFKTEVFQKAGAMKQADGIHQTFAVLTALANKPR